MKTTYHVAPLSTLLGVAFIVLKLCKEIGWSWLWVLAPFWAVPAVLVTVFIVGIGIALAMIGVGKLLERAGK